MIYETKRPQKILLVIKKVVNCFKTSVSKSLDSTVPKWCIQNSKSTCARQISYLGRAVNVNAYDFGINNVINIMICTKFILSNTVCIFFVVQNLQILTSKNENDYTVGNSFLNLKTHQILRNIF